MTRNRARLVPPLLGVLAGIASGQPKAEPDKIIFADDKQPSIEVMITKESFKEVIGTLSGSAQRYTLGEIREIVHAEAPPSYQSGETHREKGEWENAVAAFERAARDANARPWVKQYAYFQIAECRRLQGDAAKALQAYDRLLQEFPDTRFYLDVYRARFDLQMSAKNPAAAAKVVTDLRAQANANGMKEWLRHADAMEAGAFEAQGKYKEAFDKYASLAADKDAEIRSQGLRGQIRCLAQLKDWGRLRPLASSVLVKESDPDLLAAAYNGMGDADRGEGKAKDALWSYLRVIVSLASRKIDPDEHARALFGAGASFAKGAETMTDKEQKTTWQGRAVQNFRELRNRYPDSPLAPLAAGELRKLGTD